MNTKRKLKHIMSKELITIDENQKYAEFSDSINSKGVHHLLVENDLNELSGIISTYDIAKVEKSLISDKIQAKHIMTKNPQTLSKNDRIQLAVDIFKENKFRAIPIVNKHNKAIGIVTLYDIIKLI